MSKTSFKPGNMIYPLPAVMVSCGNIDSDSNILTVAWTGTICTNPPMAYISVRPERHSYDMIKNSGEFVINLTNEQLIKATDFCGVRSGRDVDKWKECRLTKAKADTVKCPLIDEAPVNIECKVKEIRELGSHHMFIADVTAVHADDKYMDANNSFHLNDSNLLTHMAHTLNLADNLEHSVIPFAKKRQTEKRSTNKFFKHKLLYKERVSV